MILKGAIGTLLEYDNAYTFTNVTASDAAKDPVHVVIPKELLWTNHGHDIEVVTEAMVPVQPVKEEKPKRLDLNMPKRLDLSTEEWREYEWTDEATGKVVTKRFTNPVAVYLYRGCTTHHVVTLREGKEVATLVPAIGLYGCTVTWQAKEGKPLVSF